MKRILLFCGILFLLSSTVHLMTSCTGCSRKKANDVTSLPGVYKGEATIELPDHIKSMIKPASRREKINTGRTGSLQIRNNPKRGRGNFHPIN